MAGVATKTNPFVSSLFSARWMVVWVISVKLQPVTWSTVWSSLVNVKSILAGDGNGRVVRVSAFRSFVFQITGGALRMHMLCIKNDDEWQTAVWLNFQQDRPHVEWLDGNLNWSLLLYDGEPAVTSKAEWRTSLFGLSIFGAWWPSRYTPWEEPNMAGKSQPFQDVSPLQDRWKWWIFQPRELIQVNRWNHGETIVTGCQF